MAEDFEARPTSPQIACLQGVRDADIVVLILGERYGPVQPTGLSATHEEYREARGTKHVLAFVQQGVTPEPRQAELITEVQDWEAGLFRGGFADAEDLHAGIIRALHDVALTDAVGTADPEELTRRALALIPPENRNMSSTGATVDIAIAMGPRQQVLRPVEIESRDLSEHVLQSVLFGPDRLFSPSLGNKVEIADGALVIRQDRGAFLRLSEDGSILILQPLDEPSTGRGWDMGGHMVIIQEIVQQRIATALGFATTLIDHIDATQRLTHAAVAVRIAGAEYRAWRTRSQNDASPDSVTIGMGERNHQPVVKVQRRAALRVDRSRLIEDLLVPLRRQFPAG